MKRRFGCLRRILLWGILLGVLGAVGLGWLGYEKAEAAEAERVPVAELGSLYLGEEPPDIAQVLEPGVLEKLGEIVDENGILGKVIGKGTGGFLGNFLAEHYYLPEDDTISAAIGRKILAHRLMKSYSEAELVVLCCKIQGTEDILNEGIFDEKDRSEEEYRSFLSDILTTLEHWEIFSEAQIEALREKLENDV